MSAAKTIAFLCALAAVAITPAGRAATPVFAFEPEAAPRDLNQGLDPAELYYHPSDDFFYGENWHFMARLDTGTIVYVNVLITNMGLTRPSAAVEFSILGKDGAYHTSKKDYPGDQITASTTAYSVAVAGNKIGGLYPDYQVHLDQDGIVIELAYHNLLPGWKLNNGAVYFGADRGQYWKYAVTSPSARVEGTISINGKSEPAQGFGFQDHSLMNTAATSFSQRWVHFRYFSGADTVIVSEIETAPGYEPGKIGLVLVGRGGKIVGQGTDVDLTLSNLVKDDEYGYAYPGRIQLSAGGTGFNVAGTVTMTRLLERIVVLSHIDSMLRAVVYTVIAKPVYYRCLNTFDFTLTQDGQARHITGEAPTEVVFIK